MHIDTDILISILTYFLLYTSTCFRGEAYASACEEVNDLKYVVSFMISTVCYLLN